MAELLISLAILGVIATFTIPKILQAQQNQQFNAIGKETVAMGEGALQRYILTQPISASTTFGALTPYMNYVAVDSTTVIDNKQTQTNASCDGVNWFCLKLHNGGIIMYSSTDAFGGTAITNAVWFMLDPDGVDSGTTDGPGKAISFFLYTNGRIATRGTLAPGTATAGGPIAAVSAYDPPWFSW